MGDTELIGTSHTSTEEGATVIVNQLLIGTTPRDYYGAKIQCRAQGTKLIEPVTKEVALQVYCKSYQYYHQGNKNQRKLLNFDKFHSFALSPFSETFKSENCNTK